MENSYKLANRFREVIHNGTWIANTNYKLLLANTDWEEATLKIGTLNTIADISFHVNYYIQGILEYFSTGQLTIRDKYSFDATIIDSRFVWDIRRKLLFDNAELLAIEIENLSSLELEKPFVNIKYGTYRRNIEGIIEHSYYHMGQIILIKKLIMENLDSSFI